MRRQNPIKGKKGKKFQAFPLQNNSCNASVFFTVIRQGAPGNAPLLLGSDEFTVVESIAVGREQSNDQKQNESGFVHVEIKRQRANERHVVLKQSQTLFSVTQLFNLHTKQAGLG